jgi:hypothetical protein
MGVGGCARGGRAARRPEAVEQALARGTGWAGGGRAHHPRSASGRLSQPVSVQTTEEERATWEGAAKRVKRTLSEWCRDELYAAAERVNSEAAANLRQRS